MNILKLLFLILVHVSAGFRSLDDLETFYRVRPSYDPYGTVSSMMKLIPNRDLRTACSEHHSTLVRGSLFPNILMDSLVNIKEI